MQKHTENINISMLTSHLFTFAFANSITAKITFTFSHFNSIFERVLSFSISYMEEHRLFSSSSIVFLGNIYQKGSKFPLDKHFKRCGNLWETPHVKTMAAYSARIMLFHPVSGAQTNRNRLQQLHVEKSHMPNSSSPPWSFCTFRQETHALVKTLMQCLINHSRNNKNIFKQAGFISVKSNWRSVLPKTDKGENTDNCRTIMSIKGARRPFWCRPRAKT